MDLFGIIIAILLCWDFWPNECHKDMIDKIAHKLDPQYNADCRP